MKFVHYAETLDKKGNSNTGERTVLPELFRETFPEVHIETLYADREFIGNEWLAYLRQAGISYCIRCKENAQIAGKGGTRQPLNGHFRALKTGEGKRLGPVMMYGQQHYLEATCLTYGQLLVVCSDEEGKGIEVCIRRALADRDAVWQPEKQGVQPGRHTYS